MLLQKVFQKPRFSIKTDYFFASYGISPLTNRSEPVI